MIAAITGHRPPKINNEYINIFDNNMFDNYGPISKAIYKRLEATFIEQSVTELIIGMALGVDQIAAHVAVDNNIPYTAAVPCDNQEKMWLPASRDWYNYLLSKAKEIVVVSPGPYMGWKMQKRNEWMVDRCETLIDVWDEIPTGGTFNCLKYAAKKGTKNIHINLNELC